MVFKLVSKNNMGIVATLILVILLSQSRCFDFLTETPLGRIVLLALTIFITYTNKIFGLLAVLFIIVAFNLNDLNIVQSYNFYEGFDGSGNVDTAIGEDALKEKIDDVKDDVKKDSKEKDVKKSTGTVKEKLADSSETTTTSSSVSSDAREGFCMSDRELNILRGKQSNTVPVFNKSREQESEVDPADKSFFSSDYALF
jgi:hypothetical protein